MSLCPWQRFVTFYVAIFLINKWKNFTTIFTASPPPIHPSAIFFLFFWFVYLCRVRSYTKWHEQIGVKKLLVTSGQTVACYNITHMWPLDYICVSQSWLRSLAGHPERPTLCHPQWAFQDWDEQRQLPGNEEQVPGTEVQGELNCTQIVQGEKKNCTT